MGFRATLNSKKEIKLVTWVISWGGVLSYMSYIAMCGPKGYGFSAILVIYRVSILAILLPFWS